MHPRTFSRRHLLGSSAAALASTAVFAGSVKARTPSAAHEEWLHDLQPALAARAGLAHKGQVRRVPMPALLRHDLNPHFRPVGPALSADEQAAFRPGPVSGRGL